MTGKAGRYTRGVPVTVLGGYLGAGKTTLLNHLLKNNRGRRLAVVVNDFGNINIDIDLIESQDNQKINLANGCVCCTLGADLATTLMELADQSPTVEHIIIEASGVANPGDIAKAGLLPGLHMDGVFVLVDAETAMDKAKDRFVGATVLRQIRQADLVVINKTDLVDQTTLHQLEEWLNDIAPDARVFSCQFGQVASDLVLGDHPPRDENHPKTPKQGEANTHPHFATWSFTSPKPINAQKFQHMIEQLPQGILRAKGIVYLTQHKDGKNGQEGTGNLQAFTYQQVGQRWVLEAAQPSASINGTTEYLSRIIMIGHPNSINEAWLSQQLD